MPKFLVTFRNLNQKEDLYKTEIEANDSDNAISLALAANKEKFDMIQPDCWVAVQKLFYKEPENDQTSDSKAEEAGKTDGQGSQAESLR